MPVGGARDEREDRRVQTHRWRYCTSYFPSTSLPGNGSSSAGVSAVLLGIAGDMRTFFSMERTSGSTRASAMRATAANVSLRLRLAQSASD